MSGVRSGFRVRFLNKSAFLSARLFERDSAMGHILGIPKEKEEPLVGQHPPALSAFQDEHKEVLELHPDQPDDPKVLKIAIIGAPNAGKSTLSNQLLGRKVLPVSQKVHTTRRSALGVFTKEDTQLIILDTPGLTTPFKRKRHHLEDTLLYDPFRTLKKADLVVVLVDVSDPYTQYRLQPQVLKALQSVPETPSVLVLNKVDLVKKRHHLLHLVARLTEGVVHGDPVSVTSALRPSALSTEDQDTRTPQNPKEGRGSPGDTEAPRESRTAPEAASDAGEGAATETPLKRQKKKAPVGWPHFTDVFMLAAVHGEEVETLRRYLLQQAKPGPWRFHSEVLTSQSPQEVCDNTIREKLLEYLPKEVPYRVEQRPEGWSEGPTGELVILQNLVVRQKSHLKMLIGPEGEMIKRIAQEAGRDLMNAFLCDVHLKLRVTLEK